MALAFFDLDRTLISINSGNAWLKREIVDRQISAFEALRAATWLAQYHFGFADLEHAVEETIRGLAGKREDELRARVDAFYDETIRHLYRPGARPVIERHRARGDRLVLLTSASCYLAEIVREELQFDDVLSNRFEVDARGVFSGRPLGELCFGPGKRRVAEAYVARVGTTLASSTFYTDSMADAVLLEVVGHPVAVNPDPRLAKLAERRGWPIEDWGTPKVGRWTRRLKSA